MDGACEVSPKSTTSSIAVVVAVSVQSNPGPSHSECNSGPTVGMGTFVWTTLTSNSPPRNKNPRGSIANNTKTVCRHSEVDLDMGPKKRLVTDLNAATEQPNNDEDLGQFVCGGGQDNGASTPAGPAPAAAGTTTTPIFEAGTNAKPSTSPEEESAVR